MTGVAIERAALHPTPRWGAAFREQLAVTGMAMWREGLMLLAFMVAAAWPTISTTRRLAESWSASAALSEYPAHDAMLRELGVEIFGPAPIALLAIVALFLPTAVWRGADASRREHLAAMPLPAAGHALLKVGAGWTWLMIGIALFALGMIATALVTRSLLGDAPVPVRLRGGAGEAWLWIVPFAGASVAYLTGSALALAVRHPSRYILLGFAATVALGVVLARISDTTIVEHPLETLFTGRLGLAAAITGITSVSRRFEAGSESMTTFVTVPDLDRWLPAMLLWLALAVVAVVVAAHRRRD